MFSACAEVILIILYYCFLYHQACVRVWKITSSDLRILQGLEIPRTKGHESYFVSFSLNLKIFRTEKNSTTGNGRARKRRYRDAFLPFVCPSFSILPAFSKSLSHSLPLHSLSFSWHLRPPVFQDKKWIELHSPHPPGTQLWARPLPPLELLGIITQLAFSDLLSIHLLLLHDLLAG